MLVGYKPSTGEQFYGNDSFLVNAMVRYATRLSIIDWCGEHGATYPCQQTRSKRTLFDIAHGPVLKNHSAAPPMLSTRSLRSCVHPLCLALMFALVAGCASFRAPKVSVTAAPRPALWPAGSLPALPDDDSRLAIVLSERDRLAEPDAQKFFAAREAFWNYETDTAVQLFRELRNENVIEAGHFHDLVFECYRRSERWADLVTFLTAAGLEESWARGLDLAKFMASLPPRELHFAAEASAVPMTLRLGTWVVVDAEINGAKARVMLDTGFNMSWVSERLARRAGIEFTPQKISLTDVNGRKRAEVIALARELRVAGLTARQSPVVVGSSLMLEYGVGIDAVVGWDVLQHADITWDFPARRLTMVAPQGPLNPRPNLAGRVAPLFTVIASTGRPLLVSFDSGCRGNNRSAIELFNNDGVLTTKISVAEFRRGWLPAFTGGVHSLASSSRRFARRFHFWLDGYEFKLPGAALVAPDDTLHRQEQLVCYDAVIGNGPFLAGRLRICGVRREVSFELIQLETDRNGAGPAMN